MPESPYEKYDRQGMKYDKCLSGIGVRGENLPRTIFTLSLTHGSTNSFFHRCGRLYTSHRYGNSVSSAPGLSILRTKGQQNNELPDQPERVSVRFLQKTGC
ncbi:MAG: hypothetical protein KDA96_02300 [Planctomycetaceae bacterium]|nr:hypothetical protein [Planctomycetaceae bacterium]